MSRPPIPNWTQCALKGAAFWIGHRRELYRHHPLSEGAIVGELCNLIASELDENKRLDCEVGYRNLLKDSDCESELAQSMSRADLVVSERPVEENSYFNPCHSIIEVKRAQSSRKRIDVDLERLAEANEFSSSRVRTFLVVVSQGERPSRFTNSDGNALKRTLETRDAGQKFWVRRSCKAAASFEGYDTAHYGCLLEVPGPK
jgi:hypothetical protein